MLPEAGRLACLALAVFTAACDAAPDPTDVTMSGSTSPELGVLPPGAVVFQAELNRAVVNSVSCNQGICTLDFGGTGAANIMGPVTWATHIVQDFTTTPCNDVLASVTLTGETGSISLADVAGTVCPTPGEKGFGFLSSTWEVSAGSGEFSGLSGTGTTSGPIAGQGPVVHLDGVVSY